MDRHIREAGLGRRLGPRRRKGPVQWIGGGAIVVCGAVMLMGQAPSRAADTPENRRLAAERYLAIAPRDEMIAELVRQMAEGVPSRERTEFVRQLKPLVKPETVNRVTADALVRHFTGREINALTSFYGSPEGRAIMKKFGSYTADVMAALQPEMTRLANEAKARMLMK